ncbi:MAG: hypothetical protein N4Q13_09870, partial [Lactobacillus crispatus]|nr:hypothetical protein [Lactobacillus crispatus]MCT7889788.1 hypothetical protein [Lactobacillus crispatus]
KNQFTRKNYLHKRFDSFIKDDDHSLNNIYRDLYIKHDMSFSIPFNIREGSGQLKVVRNGDTVLNEKVTK